MRKTLRDVASYLQEILVPDTREAYAIKTVYAEVFPSQSIREGVVAFRAFLSRLYDILAAEGDAYDNTKKAAHEYENRTTLSVYYPFLHHVKTLLMNMGYSGAPAEGAQALICENSIFNEKLSTAKTLECLRFLARCGLCVDGVDMGDKRQNLSDVKALRVTYPDDPVVLTGMKVMAIVERDHGTLINQDVFLRCDYRALKEEEADAEAILRDTLRPLSEDVQAFVLRLHRRYLDRGLTCAVEVKGFHIYIKHCYKRKDFWGFNASLNNGFHINVKAEKAEEYADAVKAFPPFLREVIAKGYGCGRKRAVGHCDGGCRGMIIPLDDSVLAMGEDIATWFDLELEQRKRK